VYINIGTFHQEWIQHFRPMVGTQQQTPIPVKAALENSVYWQATQDRADNLAKFFLKSANPMYLQDAPGGTQYLTQDASVIKQGKLLFADRCAACHSSKLPPASMAPDSPDYQAWMRQEVLKPDFLDNNYLSSEKRYSVAEIKTNACSTLATNALRGHIWDNFSSETYKTLPAVGAIEVAHPLDGTISTYEMPGDGRGYHRSPSLISMWATAPYFHNNALGKFTNDPSVEGRIAAFDDAVEKLLWPEKRQDTDCATTWGLPFCPPIYRTTQESYLQIFKSFLPSLLHDLAEDDGYVRIGPIPAGTPIGLLGSLDLEITLSDPKRLAQLLKVLVQVKKDLKRIKRDNLDEAQRKEVLKELVPDLLKVSKCKDFVVDRGHEFGSDLSDADKRALIAFLKML
jgi:hypothetical protein